MPKFSLLILCAGFGNRMLDLTKNTPKPLLKIGNKTLLGNAIDFFKDIGCDEIFVNTHYLHNKFEKYLQKNYNNYSVNLVYEPLILGTGGAVKNIFNYSKNVNLCVINSDIFWNKANKLEISEFLEDFNEIKFCKILLSKKNNFFGLKKSHGDFSITNNIITNWNLGNDINFYSGIQIVSRTIFKETNRTFSMNKIWNSLIIDKKLEGSIITSKILHLGDKKSFHKL